MRSSLIRVVTAMAVLFAVVSPATGSAQSAAPVGVGSGPCGLAQAALCETFDSPSTVASRGGQMNPVLWGASRIPGDMSNFGQGKYFPAATTQLTYCDGSSRTVLPPNDIVICNGQLRESSNDFGGVSALAMYPKQPFDFAGRTGTIQFDVSNDTFGSHSAWPELWVTDKPVPGPFKFNSGNDGVIPQNAFGLRMYVGDQKGSNLGGACPNDGKMRWTMAELVVIRNYEIFDNFGANVFPHTQLDCVTSASQPGQMNHVVVNVSQNQIDMWATDAGTTAPLHHLGTVTNANLSITRGLVWIEDNHYNAEPGKCYCAGENINTFAWDNFGFDGPVLPRDLAFDAPDVMQEIGGGESNLGKLSPNASQPATFTVPNVSGMSQASAALLTFNTYTEQATGTINFALNGHAHNFANPTANFAGTHTYGVSVPLSEVVAGNNTVSFSAPNVGIAIANVDLIMVGAGGTPAGGGNPPPVTNPAGPTNTPVVDAGPSTPVPPTPTPTKAPSETSTTVMHPGDTLQLMCVGGHLSGAQSSSSSANITCN